MKIGYSFWGFLGSGILDTPDGGRSHRRTLIDGLCGRGHETVFLQANRDRDEAGLDLTDTYAWDDGLPDIDVLFCEWRWSIPDRNTTQCGAVGHTCDLHRQHQLLDHYTHRLGVPTIVWDKDRQLPSGSLLRRLPHVTVCEAALHPSPGAVTLLFPVAESALEAADPLVLAAAERPLALAYVGNQYDRDQAFTTFFAPAAARVPHLVAGKWTDTDDWPQVTFAGRIPFADVDPLYRRSLVTVLLLPNRYGRAGQMTQRLFEAVLAGCLPLTPTTIRDAARFTPPALHVASAAEVVDTVTVWRRQAGSRAHAKLIAECLGRLDLFRLSRQLDTLDGLFAKVNPVGAVR